MNAYSNVKCMGYPIFNDSLSKLKLEKNFLINTINQYSYCIGEEDEEFKNALMKSDILLPDGVGIVAASKFLNKKKINKIAGSDLHEFLIKKLNEKGGSCFYLGASEPTLEKIKNRISKEYRNIKVGTYAPPFKSYFSDLDNQKMVEAVNNFKPEVLFIGMTAPKQEKWAYNNKTNVNAGLICSVGAVFDFYAGTKERPGKIWISMGLEWLGRLTKEPKRMWKRYIYYGAIFIFYLGKKKIEMILKKQTKINLGKTQKKESRDIFAQKNNNG